MKSRWIVAGWLGLVVAVGHAHAGIMQFGDRNEDGTGSYPSDPTAGATLQGLAPGVVTTATNSFLHPFPTQPAAGEFPGTDQVYTGGAPAPTHDGYSVLPGGVAGPQVLTMDYSSLVPAGQTAGGLTLGIAADDFQQPTFHEPFVAKINGVVDAAISNQLNAMDLSGPKIQFFTAGIDPSLLSKSNVLTLTIDRAGPNADGWAVDFATIGVTPVPEPSTLTVLLVGSLGLGARALRRRSRPS